MTVALSGMVLYTNNDNETNWAGTDGPDTYNNAIQGTNSESWNVAKNATETGTLTLTPGTAPNATRGLFAGWMASNLAPYYTDIRIELQSSASNFKQFIAALGAYEKSKKISGDFRAFALDYVNKGTPTGTYAPASHTVTRVIVDNSASGNIRAVINNWIDAMYFGPGHTVTGTTVNDKLFAEATEIDETTANRYGILENYAGIIYCQGDLTLNGSGTSNGETIVFKDNTLQTGASTWVNNGYSRYNLNGTGSWTLVNANIQAQPSVDGTNKVDIDMDLSSMTAWSQTGGSVTQLNALTTKSGQTHDGVVFTDVATSSIYNTPINCTFNLCGLITIQSGGGLEDFLSNKATGAVAILTANPSVVKRGTFISDGTGHAMEASAAGSFNWDGHSATGYGADGTANAVFYNNSGGHINLSVTNGAGTPTVLNGSGATTTVISNTATLTVTALDSITKSPIQGVAVIVRVTSAAAFPYLASVTITRSGLTATVSHTGHGYSTGHKVEIKGADQNEYNRIKTITVTGTDSYTFQLYDGEAPTTPATGTITATTVLINGKTDVNGEIADTRAYGASQPIAGYAAKSVTSPLYQRAELTGSVSSSTGLSLTSLMQSDEG